MKWQKKLTKKELDHIRETTNHLSLREFKRNREEQIKLMVEKGWSEPCFECRTIALKLGVEAVDSEEKIQPEVFNIAFEAMSLKKPEYK